MIAGVAMVVAALVSIAVLLAVLDLGGARTVDPARPPDPACQTACGSAPGATAAPAGQTIAPLANALPAQVTINPHAYLLVHVPRSYLGVSTEYWGLPLFERHAALLARVLSLIQVQGGGPLVLRVGGDSADATFWTPRLGRMPDWAFGLTPRWFAQTGSLLDELGARLILDLNLVTDTPLVAAEVASAARRYLPRGSIVGFEVGNEPDLYVRAFWTATFTRSRFRGTLLPSAISAANYVQDFYSYARVLAPVAPHLRLVGPALALPAVDLHWISSLLAAPHTRLGIVSAHLYPYSPCVERTNPSYPTLARLLSENATARLARIIGPAVRLAHRARLPLRLTELNSVTCGGLRGVSDTFATALWAPDAMFELLRAGVDGVNVHVRASAINGAFALTGRGLVARPLLYGMIVFARTLGPHAALVRVHVRAPRSSHLKVWAVRLTHGVLHVLLIDKGSRSANVQLQLPATGAATVQRLFARSPRARFGVTLDGQHLGRDGGWRGRPARETITHGARGYLLALRSYSAALLSVRLQPGALQ